MTRHILFPSVLYTEMMEISDQYNHEMITEVLRHTDENDASATTFWDPKGLQDNPVFKELIDKILNSVHKYSPGRYKICGMWAQVYRRGGYIGAHTHGTHPISGVYYLHVPKTEEGYHLRFVYDKWTLNGNEWDEPIETKKLLLFEGWVLHGSAPNPISEPKIVISFNFEIHSNADPVLVAPILVNPVVEV